MNVLKPILQRLGEKASQTARANGWYDTLVLPMSIERQMTNLALIHSEVSEAVEAVRKNPDHLGEELADVIIRVVEFAYLMDVDLDHEVVLKMEKNRYRTDVPARGGAKRI